VCNNNNNKFLTYLLTLGIYSTEGIKINIKNNNNNNNNDTED